VVPEAVPKALLGQSLGEEVERKVASCVALEGPDDERRLSIGLEHRLAAAPGDVAPDVRVAERSPDRPAAPSGLLVHALADLLAE
jgi:hypothetical protein